MAVHAEVEAPQSISRQTITATLQNDGFWAVVCHDGIDDGLEDVFVCLVGDTVAEREVNRIVLACADTDVAEFTCAREVLAVLVERNGHDTVGSVESFLYAVTVMHVDVDVKHSLLISQELYDAENDI